MKRLLLACSCALFVCLHACGSGGGTNLTSTTDTDAGDAGLASTDAATEDDGDAPAAASVKIVNLSWGLASTAYTTNFVLKNETDVAIESLEGIEIQIGDDPKPSVFVVDF